MIIFYCYSITANSAVLFPLHKFVFIILSRGHIFYFHHSNYIYNISKIFWSESNWSEMFIRLTHLLDNESVHLYCIANSLKHSSFMQERYSKSIKFPCILPFHKDHLSTPLLITVSGLSDLFFVFWILNLWSQMPCLAYSSPLLSTLTIPIFYALEAAIKKVLLRMI